MQLGAARLPKGCPRQAGEPQSPGGPRPWSSPEADPEARSEGLCTGSCLCLECHSLPQISCAGCFSSENPSKCHLLVSPSLLRASQADSQPLPSLLTITLFSSCLSTYQYTKPSSPSPSSFLLPLPLPPLSESPSRMSAPCEGGPVCFVHCRRLTTEHRARTQ